MNQDQTGTMTVADNLSAQPIHSLFLVRWCPFSSFDPFNNSLWPRPNGTPEQQRTTLRHSTDPFSAGFAQHDR